MKNKTNKTKKEITINTPFFDNSEALFQTEVSTPANKTLKQQQEELEKEVLDELCFDTSEFEIETKEIINLSIRFTKQQDKLLFKEFVRKLKDKIKHMSVDDETDYYDNCNYADFEREIDKLSQEVLG